jgi:hypothetical protein
MIYKKGDLIQAFKDNEVDCIMHQIHCQGGGYGGFAGKLLQEFPECIPLEPCKPGSYYAIQDIISLGSQIHPGNATMADGYITRLNLLLQAITAVIKDWPQVLNYRIGIPLIGSGLGADLGLKKDMTDLEYFKQYIAPTLDELGLNFIAYYL